MSKKFTVFIRTGNDAFQPDTREEIARILRELADKVESGGIPPHTLKDYNGNTVGTANVI